MIKIVKEEKYNHCGIHYLIILAKINVPMDILSECVVYRLN
jgi:hypothetical protein